MRQLPTKRTAKQNIIIKASFDYFGTGISKEEEKSAKKIALWAMNRKKRINLTEEENSGLWAVKTNLDDPTYAKSLSG